MPNFLAPKSWLLPCLFSLGVAPSLFLSASAQPAPTPAAPTPSALSNPWQEILAPMQRSKKPLGSRGGICAIAPAQLGEPLTVWHLNPVLMWRGEVRRMEIREPGSPKPLWEETFSPGSARSYRATPYTGAALVPGRTYEWHLFDVFAGNASTPSLKLPFRVMDAAQRRSIAQQLQTFEAEMQAKRVSGEALALQRARFFADRELLGDTIQASLETPTLSPKLQAALGNLADRTCTRRVRRPRFPADTR